MKSAIFNCRLCFESKMFVKHADLTRSHRDRQNEPFPTSKAHIQVKLVLITKFLEGVTTSTVPKYRWP